MEDLTGLRFGRLVVLSPSGKDKTGTKQWLCRCDCAGQKVVATDSLRGGKTVSCGCRKREIMAAIGSLNRSHGMRRTPEYRVWRHMIGRCTNPKDKGYRHYGGRGITICNRWRESFENFMSDMGQRPSAKHSLDRIDNSKGYEPGNCRWTDKTTQMRNTRSNLLITYRGRTQCLSAWAEELGLKPGTVQARLARQGWSVERALETDPRAYRGKSAG